MTRTLKLFAVLSIAILCSINAISQSFEGVVTYSITYLDVPAEIEGMESMLPSETIKYIDGQRIRIEQTMLMGTQVVISDFAANTSIVLMDILGNKIAMVVPEEEMENEAQATTSIEINYFKDSKTIAGYKCKKAVITGDGFETPAIVYYTTKIPYTEDQFKGLKGLPLEMTVNSEGMQMVLSATSVQKKEVEESMFVIPDDYSIMTSEELQELFGGE